MHYLLFIGAFLFFAFIAPVSVTLITCVSLFVITLVVRTTAQVVGGATVSLGTAFKAISFAFLFLVLALFTFASFWNGSGMTFLGGIPALAVVAAMFASYSAGFMVALGTTFGASVAVAVLSTVISGLLFLGMRSFF